MPSTGLAEIIRSRTAQAKNDDNDARNRLTDASAKPCRDRPTSVRATSRSVTAATDSAPSAGGTSRGSAESAT